MAKDPAFLFYPSDYLSGTMGMTFEEKGAYIELLMLQFNRGHMTSHMVGQVVGQIWDKIKDKFILDENGLWYNVRLDEEKEKRKAFSSSRRNNLLGTNQYTKKDKKEVGHMTSHMENENKDTIILNKKKEFAETIKPYVEKYGKEMCNDFFKYWSESNKSKTKLLYETKKTWEIGLRLANWSKKQMDFKPNNIPTILQGTI